MTTVIDLPAYNIVPPFESPNGPNAQALSIEGDGNSVTLSTEAQPIAIGNFGNGPGAPTNYDSGTPDIFPPADAPDWSTLVSAKYVIRAHVTGTAPVTDPEDFDGFVPTPTQFPFIYMDYTGSADELVFDAIPTSDAEVLSVEDSGNVAGGFGRVRAWLAGSTTGSVVIDYLALRLTYSAGTEPVDLPCDTTVDLDLSTSTQLLSGSGDPFGQYGDGVIYTVDGGFPDFYFAGLTLDPASKYRVTVTYDPGSTHDAGGRGVWLSTMKDADNLGTFKNLADLGGNAADSVTTTIGPGVAGWDDPDDGVAAGFNGIWFETSNDGAVSAISIRKLCTFVIPPLRQYPRSDGLVGGARRLYPPSKSIQASNRRAGGYL